MNIKRQEALCKRIDHVLLRVSMVFLVLTVTIVIANVVLRYALQLSLTWSSELARYCIIWSAMLAAVVLVNRDEHLAVDLIDHFLSARAKRLLGIFVNMASMLFFLVMLISGCLLVFRTSGQVASSIKYLPMNVVYSVIPISAVLMLLGSCVNLLRNLTEEGKPAG